ncbi:MAG: TolC family outer membrane protein, partial [Chromatiales bacterium]
MRLIIPAILATMLALPVHAGDLFDIYQLARKQDSQILSSGATLDANRENTPIARSSLLPQLNFIGTTDYVGSYTDTFSNSSDSFTRNRITLNVSQAIYNRASWMNFRKAMHGVNAAEAAYQAEEQFLIIRVAEAYFTVLAAEEDLSFSRAESRAIRKQLDQAQQRYDVGLIAITDVHEAQSAYDNARAQEIQAENALGNAREALREIIGGDPGKLANLKSRIALSKPQPSDIEYWANQALDNNPVVKAAEETVEASSREVEVQRSGHFPTLDLVGNAVREEYGSAPPLDQFRDQETSNIGLELRIPLYSGGRTTAS